MEGGQIDEVFDVADDEVFVNKQVASVDLLLGYFMSRGFSVNE